MNISSPHIYESCGDCRAGGEMVLKRAFDVTASLALLILLSPLLLIIAILVWIEDGGPIFFAQTRVGQFGREFKMYKIRSIIKVHAIVTSKPP